MNRFPLDRLINLASTGEGSNLPPRQFGSLRVPIVTNLRILQTQSFIGGTDYTLAWNSPEFPNVKIAQYNVYVTGINGVTEPQGPYTAHSSPAVINVSVRQTSRLIFTVQTQLTNGLTSPINVSPSVAAEALTPTVSGGNLAPSGVTPGTYGTSSQVGTFTVDAGGLITSAVNTQIYLDRLRLPVRTETTGPYTIVATDFLVIGDTTGGSFTINLPATPTAGDMYSVKKSVAANTLTFSGNGKNIDGAASVGLTTQYDTRTVIYNGTEWSVI